MSQGEYRFRADLNGTYFWSNTQNNCTLPGCTTVSVTVTKPLAVTVTSQTGTPYPDLKVYAFDGTRYTGFNGTTDINGQVIFTLPQGDYHFRADYDGVQFWNNAENTCTLPGCESADVLLPGKKGVETVTIDYTYDPLYRLTSADYSTGDFYHYAYDSVGNRLTQGSTVNGLPSTVNYVYDIANRLTSADGVNYTWDNNGNLLSDGVNTYTYDSANRLVAVSGEQGVGSSYAYNGLGDRLSQTVDGISTNYTLDLNAGLTQVLDDGTNTYLYGNGRISQSSIVNQQSEIAYFLGDALGSVRQLIDQSGAVTFAQTYDPYGAITATAGTSHTDYGFTNEQQDVNLVYLRARYYNVSDGRFQSRDMWGGDENLPMSYNVWLYVYANPVNLTDPSGYKAYSSLPPMTNFNGYAEGTSTSFTLALFAWSIEGSEVVYDFETLEKGVFRYRGVKQADSNDDGCGPEANGIILNLVNYNVSWYVSYIDGFDPYPYGGIEDDYGADVLFGQVGGNPAALAEIGVIPFVSVIKDSIFPNFDIIGASIYFSITLGSTLDLIPISVGGYAVTYELVSPVKLFRTREQMAQDILDGGGGLPNVTPLGGSISAVSTARQIAADELRRTK